MAMPAKYNGTCAECGGIVTAGKDEIERGPSGGWAHVECVRGTNALGAYIKEQVSRGRRHGGNHICAVCHDDIVNGDMHTVLYTMGSQARDGTHNWRREERVHNGCMTPKLRRSEEHTSEL